VSNKGGSGTSDIIPVQSLQAETHPRGIIDAISNIEYYHAQEKRGAILSAGFFTLKQKIEYFAVGFRASLISGLITAIIMPVAIGVTERMIPVFGSSSPTAFDVFFVFLLAFGFSLGYACFIARAASLYIGPYTRSMIRNFVGGVITGAIGKMTIGFIFFHFMYLVVLTERNVAWLLLKLKGKASKETLSNIYLWVMDFRPVFITSAYLLVITTVVFIAIPLIAMFLASVRNRKLEKVKAISENY
jgi:hypothetical protein